MSERLIRCRYMPTGTRFEVKQCTGEVADPGAELLLCTTHLAATWRMIADIRQGALGVAA